MCGLIAAWDPFRQYNKALNKAVKDLEHRGPDSQNIILIDEQKIFLAHTRLKIIDVSNNANQPFFSPCGRWILIYNGEIYNFRELRKEIGDRWSWKTMSDTEVLLAAWTLWGKKCLSKLVGMFAFIINDTKNKKLIIVRDRFGIKPLYRLTQKNLIAFASEINPLLRLQKNIAPDNGIIRTYLETGLYDHSHKTFFNEISSIKTGSITEIDLYQNKEKTEKWYKFTDNVQKIDSITEKEIIEETERLTRQAVSSNLIADVPIGLNVSGGVDSSMLVSLAIDKLGHADLFTQDYAGYSELPWVKKISKGGTLNVENLTADRIKDFFNDTVKSQCEPFGGVFVCGYNALYKSAREKNIKVLLDGNGVDEAFLGYEKYHQLYVETASNSNEYDKRKEEFTNFWQCDLGQFNPMSSIDGSSGLNPEAIDNNLLKNDLILPSIDSGFEDPVRNLAANDLLYNKIPRGLRFNDRVSMFHSCELRVPFLDHRLVEFAFSIPINLLLNSKGSKVVFRKVLAKNVSSDIAFAKKRSIQSPQREWLAEGWRKFVKDIIDSKSFADRGWVVPKIAKEMYSDYLNGERKNSFFIWQWINLELWARNFIDRDKLI
jgi:asparagine synthase (glutamine-hydrolysing)